MLELWLPPAFWLAVRVCKPMAAFPDATPNFERRRRGQPICTVCNNKLSRWLEAVQCQLRTKKGLASCESVTTPVALSAENQQ